MRDEYINHIICSDLLKQFGIFNPISTGKFLSRVYMKEVPNERDSMLFMGILTTQILYDQFITSRNKYEGSYTSEMKELI
jgi:hypothetical protein